MASEKEALKSEVGKVRGVRCLELYTELVGDWVSASRIIEVWGTGLYVDRLDFAVLA